MKRETFFLKVVVFLIGVMVLALCVFWLPRLAGRAAEINPELAYIQYPVLIGLYITAIPFFFALYQVFKLLSYIDNNDAFSAKSVKSIKSIKHCALIISFLYAAGTPLLFSLAKGDTAPGFIVLGLFIAFASVVIATFAAVLEKLLKSAIDIKSENDLTV